MSRTLTLLFAVTCGLAVGSAYFSQPLLDEMAAAFRIDHAAVGGIMTITQVGLGLGLLLIVPLGDALDRRRLVAVQLAVGVAALVVVGTATSTVALLAGVAAVGASSVVTQVLVAYAATLSTPAQRGSVVGVVTSGVIVGILLARTFAGAITDLAGWRAVYLVAAALMVLVTVLLARALPRRAQPRAPLHYPRLVGSTFALIARAPVLRARGLLALLIFAAFTTLWTALVLPLSAPPHSLSHGAIGLFGLAGAAGAMGAVRAGRLADRGRAQATTGVALGLMLVAWAPIAMLDRSLLMLAVGVVLLDLAVQAVHVTNQSLILAELEDARSRATAGYMLFYSVGSALGSIAATATYAAAGWTGVCLQGAAISAAALLCWVATAPRYSHLLTEMT